MPLTVAGILKTCEEIRKTYLETWPRDFVISTFVNKLASQEKFVQKSIERGNVSEVAVSAFHLGLQMGTLAGQHLHLIFKPHAQRGLKVLRGAKLGHMKTYGSKLQNLLVGGGLQNEVEVLKRRKPRLSLTAVRKQIAREHHISYRTLLRLTSRFRKK